MGKGHKKTGEIDWSSQGALVLGGTLFLAIVLYALLGSCRPRTSGTKFLTEEMILPSVVQYGGEELPGKTFLGMEAIRTEKNPDLIQEVKKIIDSHGMPSDVFQDDIPPEKNIAAELNQSFKIYKQNPGELERLRRVVPRESWKIDEETLGSVSDILERIDPKRQEIREMLNEKDVCFSFEFILDPEFGKIPDTEASDFMADYALLEEFAVAQALLEGKMDEATESIAYIFRLAQLAAEVKNPGIRTKAARIRLHTLEIMQTVVLDPKFREENLIYLYRMLQEQLDHWTPDGVAWIGDRASGMKVYNLIIQNGVEAALEPEELEEMIRRGVVKVEQNDRLVLAQYGALARDQIFYLKSMQAIIDSCEKPFYQRLPVLNRITDQIRSSQGTDSEAIVAEFLLRGIRELMQYCAQDRTRCEMAVLAMATSLKDSPPKIEPDVLKKSLETLTVDSLYGKKYEVRRIRNDREPAIDVVWCSYFGNPKPFRVPDYSVKR